MKQIFIFLVIFFSLTPTVYSQNAPLKLGAERMDVVTRLLKGKRVGLVVHFGKAADSFIRCASSGRHRR